jgi:hypothetical protein
LPVNRDKILKEEKAVIEFDSVTAFWLGGNNGLVGFNGLFDKSLEMEYSRDTAYSAQGSETRFLAEKMRLFTPQRGSKSNNWPIQVGKNLVSPKNKEAK